MFTEKSWMWLMFCESSTTIWMWRECCYFLHFCSFLFVWFAGEIWTKWLWILPDPTHHVGHQKLPSDLCLLDSLKDKRKHVNTSFSMFFNALFYTLRNILYLKALICISEFGLNPWINSVFGLENKVIILFTAMPVSPYKTQLIL